jgi:hypothetical protein
MVNKIISFYWDHGKGEEHNGKSLIIGQFLPKVVNSEATHIPCYGISLDVISPDKDFQLHNYSCSNTCMVSEVKEISKEEARKKLYEEIDKALDVLYDESEIKTVDEKINRDPYIVYCQLCEEISVTPIAKDEDWEKHNRQLDAED